MCCDAWLYDTKGRPVVGGTTMDVSDSGMQLAVPASSGIGRGQQVRFRMAVPRRHELGNYIEEVYGRALVVRAHSIKGMLSETLTLGLEYDAPMPLLVSSTVRGCVVTSNLKSA